MILLKQQLIVNWPTLYFIYGLSFFLLGFAIVIQRGRTSRLHLATALPMLAFFALIHGSAEWGYLFIPIHKPQLDAETVQGLRVAQALMWALSFVFLICFGLSLLKSNREKAILWPLGIFGAFTVFGLWIVDHSVAAWLKRDEVRIFIRYFLCAPGALLSSIGLWRQQKEFKNLGSEKLLRYLKLASVAFAAYMVAGGLIVPEAEFFPANVINRNLFQKIFGFPIELLRASLSIIIAVAISKVLRMFDLEEQNRFANLNRREVLAEDRERISRDLHDGVIQSIYAIGLILQKLKKTGPGDSQWYQQMNFVLKSLDGIVTDIRSYIQDLRSRQEENDLEITVNLLENAFSIPIEIEAYERTLHKLSPFARNHIIFIIRESLSNICKHAEASKAVLRFRADSERVEIEIRHDGKGFHENTIADSEEGNKMGLNNIRSRIATLNGTMDIKQNGSGLSIIIRIPWEGNSFAETSESVSC